MARSRWWVIGWYLRVTSTFDTFELFSRAPSRLSAYLWDPRPFYDTSIEEEYCYKFWRHSIEIKHSELDGVGAGVYRWNRSWHTTLARIWLLTLYCNKFVSYCTLFGLQTNGGAKVNANSTRARMRGCLGLFGLFERKYRSVWQRGINQHSRAATGLATDLSARALGARCL